MVSSPRRYLITHPWITFQFDLGRLNPKTWLQLGDIGAKCQHLAGVPLKPDVSQSLMLIYLSKGAHGTSAIEGNTLSEEEVLKRVDGDLPLPPSKEYLGHEIDNIVRAFNETALELARGESGPLSPDDLLNWNKLLLDGQPIDDDVKPGNLREHSVGVLNYRGAPAEDCQYLLERLCEWLRDAFNVPADQEFMTIPVRIVRALLAHLYIAWIHPFGDGNGRVARMAEFQLLLEAGLPYPACHLLSNHYHLTREAYYQALDKTSRASGFPVEVFISYAVQGFVDQLSEQWTIIRDHQMEVTWQNHVHEQFSEQHTAAPTRQKHIALDLPPDRPTPIGKVRHVSVRVAEAYGGKTSKTVTRDLHALEKLKLIKRVKGGVIPNRDKIKGFLPASNDQN